MSQSAPFDVAVIGAGAAGMMCAAVAGQRGLRVVLIEHAERLAEKIRISGGGRCNFTNIGAGPEHYLSRNPAFCRSALAGYGPRDFLALMGRHRIAWHEKHLGQLFCDHSSQDIIDMLQAECASGSVQWRMPCQVEQVAPSQTGFVLDTSVGRIAARQVVVATGGMAVPQVGATDFALGLARKFNMKVVEPRPALVPLVFDAQAWQPFAQLAGIAMPAGVRSGKGRFVEDMLFTHRGLSGPAILQISSYWDPQVPLQIDLAPGHDLASLWRQTKSGSRQTMQSLLTDFATRRFAEQWLARPDPELVGLQANARHADQPDRVLNRLAQGLSQWTLVPTGTAGYRKAEVMRGGVDTAELDQKSLQSRRQPGLYFIGEAVDVTGWLGGYNFQWAWASGVACGRALVQGHL